MLKNKLQVLLILAIRWYASSFSPKQAHPLSGKSLIQNIGQDASGTHKGDSNIHQTLSLTENKCWENRNC